MVEKRDNMERRCLKKKVLSAVEKACVETKNSFRQETILEM